MKIVFALFIVLGGVLTMAEERVISYPDFFAMDARKTHLSFDSIKAYPDELQIVVFKLKQIEWSKPQRLSEKSDPSETLERGKAKIEIVEVLASESQKMEQGKEYWLSGYRSRNRKQYIIDPKTNKPSMLAIDQHIMVPGEDTLFIGLLKSKTGDGIWVAVYLMRDMEDSYSDEEILKGFREKIKTIATPLIKTRNANNKK